MHQPEAAIFACQSGRQGQLLNAPGGQLSTLRKVDLIYPLTSNGLMFFPVSEVERVGSKHQLVVSHDTVHAIRG